jgi:hypothetical protein
MENIFLSQTLSTSLSVSSLHRCVAGSLYTIPEVFKGIEMVASLQQK